MKRLGSDLSIRHILVGVIGAMALLAGGLTLQSIWAAYARHDVSKQVVSLAGLNKNLFEALGAFRLERAAMQSAVILPGDKAQESIKTYEMRRKLVEDALASANRVLGPAQRPALVAARADLAAAHEDNRKIRQAVEAAIKLPVESRDKQLAGQVLAVGEKLLVSLDRASLTVDGEIRALNPALTELVATRALAWSARTYAGTAGIMISTIAAQARPLDARESAALLGANSGALATWTALRDIADTAQADPAIKAAIARAQATYFSGPTHEMREALSQRVTNGGKPEVGVDQWRSQIVPALETIANVASVAIDQAIALAEAADRAAFVSLAGYGALLGLGLLLAIVGFIVVRSRVTAPLDAMTAAMTQLAQGNLAATLPTIRNRDEMGAMASALSVFRDNLTKMRELEQHEQARAGERLARAESMASVVSDVGAVVEAAAAGDFSARLALDHADAEMGKLVAGINEINRVVDAATTEFSETLQAISAGDLTHRVDGIYRGRFAELKDAINGTADKLSATLRTIQATASDVGLSAREISTGADDLSKRTEDQASSLEESAATTEELAASVKAAAQASRQGVVLSGEAMEVAQAGGGIVTNAVSAMARIEEASKKISDIIRVIDDIAFQTNLLALNAAVEAARAGDAGKGFAVVASEVRTLAQRSSEAAKDISGLISSSNSEVEQGVKLVRQAGDALTRIVEASRKVQATVSEVAAAATEQANGIEEMSQTVAHMDEMTQQNAALAEQSAASANALSGKIGELNALVATFRTGDTAHSAPVAFAPPRLRAADHAAIASGRGREPERLRKLAEAAFEQHKAAPRRDAPAPARKTVNARATDSGWEEF